MTIKTHLIIIIITVLLTAGAAVVSGAGIPYISGDSSAGSSSETSAEDEVSDSDAQAEDDESGSEPVETETLKKVKNVEFYPESGYSLESGEDVKGWDIYAVWDDVPEADDYEIKYRYMFYNMDNGEEEWGEWEEDVCEDTSYYLESIEYKTDMQAGAYSVKVRARKTSGGDTVYGDWSKEKTSYSSDILADHYDDFVVINSEEEAIDYAIDNCDQYGYDLNLGEGYGYDTVCCEDFDGDYYTIWCYSDQDTHVATNFRWNISREGDIYDLINEEDLGNPSQE